MKSVKNVVKVLKSVFAVFMIVITMTVIFTACNPKKSDGGKTDNDDARYNVPKEVAEKQAIIDDWFENKAIEMTWLSGPSVKAILYNNKIYGSIEDMTENIPININGIKLSDGSEYFLGFNLKEYESYFSDKEEKEVKYEKVKDFAYNLYYNGLSQYGCPIALLSRFFNNNFEMKDNTTFILKQDDKNLKNFYNGYFELLFRGIYEIEDVGENKNDYIKWWFSENDNTVNIETYDDLINFNNGLNVKNFNETREWFSVYFLEEKKILVRFVEPCMFQKWEIVFSVYDGEVRELRAYE